MIDQDKLKQSVQEFLENEVWAAYYGNAPSVAKEYIALEFYASDNDVDEDAEFDELQKEVVGAMEDEDLKYIAEHSPNAMERNHFAKLLKDNGEGKGGKEPPKDGDEGKGGEDNKNATPSDNADDPDKGKGKGEGDDDDDDEDEDAGDIQGGEGLKIGVPPKNKDDE